MLVSATAGAVCPSLVTAPPPPPPPPPLQVAVPPGARIPQKAVKVKVWEKRVAQEGGTFQVGAEEAGVTHLLCGDEPLPRQSRPLSVPWLAAWV